MPSLNKRLITICLLVFTVVFLAGCGGQPGAEETAAPEFDQGAILTQAVETVAAQLTTTAMAAVPPASPTAPPVVEPTNPPQEMSWPTPTAVGGAALPAGNNAAAPGAAAAANPALPATTQAAVLPPATGQQVVPAAPTTAPTQADKLLEQAMMISQSPGYGWKVNPGASFDIVWAFENTADAPWNERYTVRRYGGETFGLESSKYTFADNATNVTVSKGEATTITIRGARAPVGEGVYRSQWRLCNNRDDEGKPYQCFYLMEIEIVVSN